MPAKKTYIPLQWILLACTGTGACVESQQGAPIPRVSLAASTWRLHLSQTESPEGELLKSPSYAQEFLNDSTFLFRLSMPHSSMDGMRTIWSEIACIFGTLPG